MKKEGNEEYRRKKGKNEENLSLKLRRKKIEEIRERWIGMRIMINEEKRMKVEKEKIEVKRMIVIEIENRRIMEKRRESEIKKEMVEKRIMLVKWEVDEVKIIEKKKVSIGMFIEIIKKLVIGLEKGDERSNEIVERLGEIEVREWIGGKRISLKDIGLERENRGMLNVVNKVEI